MVQITATLLTAVTLLSTAILAAPRPGGHADRDTTTPFRSLNGPLIAIECNCKNSALDASVTEQLCEESGAKEARLRFYMQSYAGREFCVVRSLYPATATSATATLISQYANNKKCAEVNSSCPGAHTWEALTPGSSEGSWGDALDLDMEQEKPKRAGDDEDDTSIMVTTEEAADWDDQDQ